MTELAIVIPAYKGKFFRKTLESIASQTCKDFVLYIGDDNSPYDLEAIVDDFRTEINIVYRKFEENIGRKDLTASWDRCVKMSSEPYVYFFSDDDMMPDDAVSRIYDMIRKYPDHDIFRFHLKFIDDSGKIFKSNPPLPDGVSTAEQVLCDKLGCRTSSTACEYVFTRKVYDRTGGFVSLPLAWGSDDATWYKFGLDTGIVNIPGAAAMWRDGGGENISTNTTMNREKFEGTILFMHWLKENYRYLESRMFRKDLKRYLKNIIRSTVQMDYTRDALWRLCKAVSGMWPYLSVYLLFKFYLKGKAE